MGIIYIILVLLCISTGMFAIGVVSGAKLGSCYKAPAVLKTAGVFVGANLVALSLGFVLGRLMLNVLAPQAVLLVFCFLFLIGIRLLMESIEKSPSLNYTDILQNVYLLKVAAQASIDSLMFGFALAMAADKLLLAALLFSAVFNFGMVLFGFSHGHAANKTVLGNRVQLVSAVAILVLAVRFLIVASN